MEIVWKPYGSYIEDANIKRFMDKHGIKDYDELIKRSTEDIEWFWDAALKDLGIEWYKPYTKVYDDSEGIQWTKWFIDGKLNIVHNCLDRHAKGEKKNNIACIWEGDGGEVKRLTYEELYKEVNKLANAFKSIGVVKGDTIGIYMPMVSETVIGFLASLKIGAVAVPIFSAFGAAALGSRLEIANAKVLLTADGSYRRGKTFEIKEQADRTAVSREQIALQYAKLERRFPVTNP